MNTIEKLQVLKQQISAESNLPSKNYELEGQTWGGANCMVISNDRETQQYFKNFKGEILSTTYAKEVGNLYNSIKVLLDEPSGYDYLSKLELWGELTIAGREFIESTPEYDLKRLKLKIVDKAIEIVKTWQ
jgi:hypothetical protein